MQSLIWAALLVFVGSGFSPSDQQPNSRGGEQHPAARAQADWFTAQSQCDVKKMIEMTTPTATAVAPDGSFLHASEIASRFKNCKPMKPVIVEATDVRTLGTDVAVLTGLITLPPFTDGKAASKARFTSVWVLEKGQWRAAAYQGTEIRGQ
jgi:uncharacterized protein (TIGR02246 family)